MQENEKVFEKGIKTTKEMNANELRIGNLIERFDFGINYGYSDKPKMVLHEVISVDIVDITQHDRHYKPIPLTEDWLLKFGFKKILNQIKGSNLKDEYDLSFVRISHYLGIFDFHGCTKIQYVHQLQNLYYALTNQELEIK